MNKYNTIVIAGPTASGKTALACDVAHALNGEIISADSRQVYRGMDIGSGKDLGEYVREGVPVPCHLIDMVDPAETYSLYNYQHAFYTVFDNICHRGRVPVVCGGSGLYIEAVLKKYDISPVPENPVFRREMMNRDKDELVDMLAAYPSLYTRTDLSSKKRVVRSLEIAYHEESGEYPKQPSAAVDIRPLLYVLMMKPEVLRERILDRLHSRLADGLIDEVRELLDRGVSSEKMDMFGMEYRYVSRYLAGIMSYKTMVQELYTEICRLAKRQRTWFRGMERRGLTVTYLDVPDSRRIIDDFLNDRP